MFGSNRLSVVSQVVEADQMTSVVPISLEVSHLSRRCGRLFGERHQATTTAAPPSPPQHTLPPLTMSSTTRSIIGGTLTSRSPTSSSQATSVDGKKWRCVCNCFHNLSNMSLLGRGPLHLWEKSCCLQSQTLSFGSHLTAPLIPNVKSEFHL